MRLGVISDTHGKLRAQIFDLFAEVDRIVHAGDVGGRDILIELEAIAPVTAVYGNVDDFELRRDLPRVAEFDVEGLSLVVTHGDQYGSPTPDLLHRDYPNADVIVFGHTHRPLLTLLDQTVTVMNPGGAGAARFSLKPSVGIMEFEPGLPPRARLVEIKSA